MKLNAVISALRSMPRAAVDSKKNPRGERGLFSENCPFDEFFMGSNKTTFVLQNRKGANEALQIKDVPNFVGSKGTVSCYSFLFSV